MIRDPSLMRPAFDDPPVIAPVTPAESLVQPAAETAGEPAGEPAETTPGGAELTDVRPNSVTRTTTVTYRPSDEKRMVDTLNADGWASKPAVSRVVYPDANLRARPRSRRPSPLSRFIGIDLDP